MSSSAPKSPSGENGQRVGAWASPTGTTSTAQPSDASLVDGLIRGRRDALAEIYERHSAPALALAGRLCGRDQAEDVVQDVFLRLWQNPDRFQADRGSLRTYLLTMIHSRAVDVLRSSTSRRDRERAVQSTRARRTVEELTDLLADRGGGDVWHLLAEMTPPVREAIALAYFVGHSYQDVAAILGLPEGTVKSRIRTGLTELRRVLGPEALNPA